MRVAIERDGGCLICGTTDDLTAHHVDVDVEHAPDPGRYMTLCRGCHGRADAPRAQPGGSKVLPGGASRPVPKSIFSARSLGVW